MLFLTIQNPNMQDLLMLKKFLYNKSSKGNFVIVIKNLIRTEGTVMHQERRPSNYFFKPFHVQCSFRLSSPICRLAIIQFTIIRRFVIAPDQFLQNDYSIPINILSHCNMILVPIVLTNKGSKAENYKIIPVISGCIRLQFNDKERLPFTDFQEPFGLSPF